MRLRVRPKRRASDQDRAALAQKLSNVSPAQRAWLGNVVGITLLLSLSSLVEIAVPPVRALGRRRGIQTGAPLGSLLSFTVAWTCFRAAARRPASKSATDDWMTGFILAGAVILPATGAVLPATVVLPKRSPLWGWALWPVVRILASTVMAMEASRLKKRRAAEDRLRAPKMP